MAKISDLELELKQLKEAFSHLEDSYIKCVNEKHEQLVTLSEYMTKYTAALEYIKSKEEDSDIFKEIKTEPLKGKTIVCSSVKELVDSLKKLKCFEDEEIYD
jgi:hypothetical protein